MPIDNAYVVRSMLSIISSKTQDRSARFPIRRLLIEQTSRNICPGIILQSQDVSVENSVGISLTLLTLVDTRVRVPKRVNISTNVDITHGQ